MVELKMQKQHSSHEVTFTSINCTITKNIDDVNDIANELFSSFEL